MRTLGLKCEQTGAPVSPPLFLRVLPPAGFSSATGVFISQSPQALGLCPDSLARLGLRKAELNASAPSFQSSCNILLSWRRRELPGLSESETEVRLLSDFAQEGPGLSSAF